MDWITGELNTQNETHTDSLLSREWKEGRKEGKREGGKEGGREGGKEGRKEGEKDGGISRSPKLGLVSL